jgi:hypothetical protein
LPPDDLTARNRKNKTYLTAKNAENTEKDLKTTGIKPNDDLADGKAGLAERFSRCFLFAFFVVKFFPFCG